MTTHVHYTATAGDVTLHITRIYSGNYEQGHQQTAIMEGAQYATPERIEKFVDALLVENNIDPEELYVPDLSTSVSYEAGVIFSILTNYLADC